MSEVPGIDNVTISNRWLAENIQQGHGPLGAVYPDVAYGMEGDTPAWLGLIPNGLGAPEHPEWGGWGGRYEFYRPEVVVTVPPTVVNGVATEAETRPIWTNASDDYTPPRKGEYGRASVVGDRSYHGAKVTLWRWRDDFQNDFAARMDWTTKPVAAANHPPVPALAHSQSIAVRAGESFTLDAHGSTDPDGDSLSFLWFQYREAGSFPGVVPLDGAENLIAVHVVAPMVEKTETVHFILRVTDKGTPALSRFKRIVVTVSP